MFTWSWSTIKNSIIKKFFMQKIKIALFKNKNFFFELMQTV
jgi:hypothetical protein